MRVDQRQEWPIVALAFGTVAITGQQIRRERRRQKLTQQELAEAVDVSLRTIGRIERGELNDSRSLDMIAEHLGLKPGRGDDRRLLSEASVPELAARIVQLYDEALRRSAQPGISYHQGSPDLTGLIPGPTTRTDRLRDEGGDGSVHRA